MRVKFKTIILIILGSAVLPAHGAEYQGLRAPPPEYKMIFGLDYIVRETEITYANGKEKYDFAGPRLRWGLEYIRGASIGLEFIPSDSDQIIDPFGALFELEAGNTLGAYLTVGRPFHVRIGWSIWEAKYTDVATGVSARDTINAFEIGLGLNTSVTPRFSIYADYSVRKTDAEFPPLITGTGKVDYDTTMGSIGFNYLF
jgi:hypothetical protein